MEKYYTVVFCSKTEGKIVLDFSPTGEIANLLREGMKVTEIAKMIGVPHPRLYEQAKLAGMPIPRLRSLVCDSPNEKLLSLESKLYKKAIEEEDLKALIFLTERIDKMMAAEKDKGIGIVIKFGNKYNEDGEDN